MSWSGEVVVGQLQQVLYVGIYMYDIHPSAIAILSLAPRPDHM